MSSELNFGPLLRHQSYSIGFVNVELVSLAAPLIVGTQVDISSYCFLKGSMQSYFFEALQMQNVGLEFL
jgi:hypothetical protein